MSIDYLNELKVLDLSQYLPGPYASLQLSDLGANVVKIEPPGGDPFRLIGPTDSDGLSPLYKAVNGGKAILELDLKSLEGKSTLRTLIDGADVLIESFRPGTLARLGFSKEDIRALNPAVIHCAISGWGQNGPYRDKAGHDINYMALGGGLNYAGSADGPSVVWPPVADYASALQAVVAILGSVVARQTTGRGTYIDISLMESVLAWQNSGLPLIDRAKFTPVRSSNLLNGGSAAYNVYKTSDDRFVSLGIVHEENFWANFCTAVGKPEWIKRLNEPLPQLDLTRDVGRLFEGAPLAYWNQLLQHVETCYEPLAEYKELLANPHIGARQMISRRDGPDPFPEVLFPAWIDGAGPSPRNPTLFLGRSDAASAWALNNR